MLICGWVGGWVGVYSLCVVLPTSGANKLLITLKTTRGGGLRGNDKNNYIRWKAGGHKGSKCKGLRNTSRHCLAQPVQPE